MLAFQRFHVVAAVANAEVQPTIRADDQPVHVVTTECHADAVSVVQRLSSLGNAVVVGVGQFPQLWDACVVDLVVPMQNPGARSVSDVVETVGEDR